MTVTTTTWLGLEALDTVMVRDGRAFTLGADHRAEPTLPPPSTIGGAVRSALGHDVERIVGPLVSFAGTSWFPAPRDIVRDDRGTRRLGVVERPAGVVTDLDDDRALTHVPVGDGDPLAGTWVDTATMRRWVETDPMAPGTEIDDDPISTVNADSIFVPEPRVGLMRRWDGPLAGTAEPHRLYAMAHLRPKDGARLVVGCESVDRIVPSTDLVPLGGQGRYAQVQVLNRAPRLPEVPTSFPGGRVAVYLATPALLPDPWWAPPGATLRAAVTGPPHPVASRSPRRGGASLLCWAVPAGSVFYLEFDDGDPAATQWAAAHHARLVLDGPPTVAGKELTIATAGFGTCLTGRW